MPVTETKGAPQVVVSRMSLLEVVHHGDKTGNHRKYNSDYNVRDVVNSDIHNKIHDDRIPEVCHFADVLSFVFETHRQNSENTEVVNDRTI